MRNSRSNDSARRRRDIHSEPKRQEWPIGYFSSQKTISAPSVLKERPGTYSWSGQAKIPQIKNTPRLAKRCSLRSPRRTRRSR